MSTSGRLKMVDGRVMVSTWTIWDPESGGITVIARDDDQAPVGTVNIGNPIAPGGGRSAFSPETHPWGNPLQHTQYRIRAAASDDYREWLGGQPELVAAAQRELRGRLLACPCSGDRCHGRWLVEVANR